MALVFNGDFSTGNLKQYYFEQSPNGEFSPPDEVGNERIYIINEGPPGTGLNYSARFKYVKGDVKVAASERSELQRQNPYSLPGEHVWSEDYFRVIEWDKTHYHLFHQWHEDEEPTGVAFGLYAEQSSLYFEPGTGSAWWTRGGFETNRWYHILFHVYVHHSEGIVELWFAEENDPLEKQTLTNGKQIYENTNTLDAYSVAAGKTAKKVYEKIGFLRSNSSLATTIVDHSGNKSYNSSPLEAATNRQLSMMP